MNWALTLLGSLIGSILLSIAGNLLTDVFKNFIARRSLHSRQNRVKTLQREVEQIAALHADAHKALLDAAVTLLIVQLTFMTGLAAGIVASSIYMLLTQGIGLPAAMSTLYSAVAIIAVISGAGLIYIGIAFGMKGIERLSKVLNFEQYQLGVEKKLKALEA